MECDCCLFQGQQCWPCACVSVAWEYQHDLEERRGDAAEVERAQQAQRAATARSSKAEEQVSQARQAESSAHQRQIQLEHTLGDQVGHTLHITSTLALVPHVLQMLVL